MSATAVHGNRRVMVVEGDPIEGFLHSAIPAFTRADADTSTFGLGDKESIPGQRECTVTTEGYRKGDKAGVQNALYKILHNDAPLNLLDIPEAPVVGGRCWISRVDETALTTGAPVTGIVMFNITFHCTGGARLGRLLQIHSGGAPVVNDEAQVIKTSPDFARRDIHFP